VALGAKMVEFGGFMMPLKYEKYGELVEHAAVRKKVGVFDVSHMGEFIFQGKDSGRYLRGLVTNNIGKMEIGMAQYNIMCHDHGGSVDDLLIYKQAENQYMMVVNASNIKKDWQHIIEYLFLAGTDLDYNDKYYTRGRVSFSRDNDEDTTEYEIKNVSDQLGLLAIQGPETFEVLKKISGVDYSDMQYYRFVNGFGQDYNDVIVSRTGYTGEKMGVELYCPNQHLESIWNRLMECGVTPCGLAARDILRLEAGFSLYGHELTDEINPLEAGLQWAVKLGDDGFIGWDALLQAKASGIKRKVVGLVMDELRAIPRQGYPVVRLDGHVIGFVTSGTRSPIMERGIGLAMVDIDLSKVGNQVGVKIRDKIHVAKVCKIPFPCIN
jgi:aminomethyltransferase